MLKGEIQCKQIYSTRLYPLHIMIMLGVNDYTNLTIMEWEGLFKLY